MQNIDGVGLFRLYLLVCSILCVLIVHSIKNAVGDDIIVFYCYLCRVGSRRIVLLLVRIEVGEDSAIDKPGETYCSSETLKY